MWDGKSPGSVQNMIWLTSFGKKGLVFHTPTKSFVKIQGETDLLDVLGLAKESDLQDINKKIDLPDLRLDPLRRQQQQLNF